MRLGIFGDSFMDFLEGQDYAWPLVLHELIKSTSTVKSARAGCSHWYTYSNFLKKIDEVDVVIFGHTSYARWPALPEEYVGWNYRVYDSFYSHLDDVPTILKDINKYYFDIFPDELGQFISRHIFNEVNRICKEKEKYLINVDIFSEDNFELTQTIFPVLKNLSQISLNEIINLNGETKTMHQLINKDLVIDKRACHLSYKNNHRLANYLHKLLIDQPLNLTVDLYKDLEWDSLDPHTDSLFQN